MEQAPDIVDGLAMSSSNAAADATLSENGANSPAPGPPKSKAQLKAEGRARQEAQRAKKAAAKAGGGTKEVEKPPQKTDPSPAADNAFEPAPASPKLLPTVRTNEPLPKDQKKLDRTRSESVGASQDIGGAIAKLGIFSHLPLPEKIENLTRNMMFSQQNVIHPAVLKLGIQYSKGIISGSNSRSIAFIHAMKQLINDYETPHMKILRFDLKANIEKNINFLTQCRPLSVSLANTIRHIKFLVHETPPETVDSEAKADLLDKLDRYVEEKIVLAGKAIENYAAEKINDGDVILTYSYSSLALQVLVDAKRRGRKFTVVVVDGRPKMEGREMLRRLVRFGLKCSYVHITAISYIMPEISKILLGAEGLLTNGYVMSKIGSSQIALVAKAFNVPVLVCCETYKFCDRVQTDSIVHNELGYSEDLVVPQLVDSAATPPMMSRLNLMLDVTPPDMITMVITELGMVPCTSVPVVLRVKHALK